MGKHRKSWSANEKLSAVQLLKSKGVVESSREYSVSSTTLYNWEKLFDQKGIEGFKRGQKTDKDSTIQKLSREVRELKMIVAEKELELRVANALLKKNR